MLLVPVDDSVVFPNMTVTLTVDVGDEERVLLVPRKDDEFANVGTVAEVAEHVRLPGGGHAVALAGLHRGIAGAAHTDPQGELRVEVTPHPDDEPVDGKTRDLEREYRAVVEEILELRGDDGRIAAFLRSISEPGALADTAGYSPDITYEQKVELLETLDVTERLEKAARPPARAPGRDAGAPAASARTSSRAPTSSSASTSCASRWTRSARSWARTTPRSPRSTASKIEEAGMPDDVREQAEKELGPARAHGRAVGRELDDPHLPRLAGGRAVVRELRGGAGPGRTRVRCWTPTTPAWRTSRTGSWSTSAC